MTRDNSAKLPKLVLFLFIGGLLMRTGFVVISKSYVHPHDWEYGAIARNIVSGNGYTRTTELDGSLEPTSSHAPLYPYFLALFYRYGQTNLVFLVIELIQAFISAVTILIFYRMALVLFNKPVAVLTSFGMALYPPSIYYSAKLTPTTFFIFLLSLALLLVLRKGKNISYSTMAGGIVLGLSLLCDPLTFALFPALIIWYFIQRKISVSTLLLVMIISLILLIPWTVRNYSIHARIVPVTTQFGVNFWIGNNPNATGTDYYKVYSIEEGTFVLMTETLSKDTKKELETMREMERSQFFFKQGLQFIQQNPNIFLTLLFKKIYYYWWFAPQEINASIDIMKYRTAYTIFYLPLLVLGIFGIAKSFNRYYVKNSLLIFFVILFISGTYILTHVGLMRYRVPLEVCLIMYASLACYCARKYFRKS